MGIKRVSVISRAKISSREHLRDLHLPGKRRAKGRKSLILLWDNQAGPAGVLFPSFEALLSTYADQLEAGLFLGYPPMIKVKERSYLRERRAAFQQASPAKSHLAQAIGKAWIWDPEEGIKIFQQVLQMEAATPEDRFFAYYGLFICYEMMGECEEVPSLFVQLEAEARRMPEKHWAHEEVTLLKPWAMA